MLEKLKKMKEKREQAMEAYCHWKCPHSTEEEKAAVALFLIRDCGHYQKPLILSCQKHYEDLLGPHREQLTQAVCDVCGKLNSASIKEVKDLTKF